MKYLLIILTISTLIISCKKETDNKFEPYFKLKANGNKISLGTCGFFAGGGGDFSCSITEDSILLISVGCDTKAGFFITGRISNGTYQLDNKNQSRYEENSLKKFRTTINQKGNLTIEKSTFQSAGVIKTLKGKFSFSAIDTSSGQIINITDGEFLMERREY